jgi:hypothetical protein
VNREKEQYLAQIQVFFGNENWRLEITESEWQEIERILHRISMERDKTFFRDYVVCVMAEKPEFREEVIGELIKLFFSKHGIKTT